MQHNIIKDTKPNIWKDKFLTSKDLNGYYFSQTKKIHSIFLGDYIQWDQVYKEVKAGLRELIETGYYFR